MKKIIFLILSLIIALSLFAGCAGNKENNPGGGDVSVNTETDEDITSDEGLAEDKKENNDENKEENKKENKEENKEEIKNEEGSSGKPQENTNQGTTTQKKEPGLSSLMSSMTGVIPDGEHTLEEIPLEFYKDIYGIDKAEFSDVLIYGTMINVKANEIILIKVDNESEISKAVDTLTKRKEQVYKTWEQYLPEQFEMVKNSVIKTNGKYAALIITPKVSDVANKFDALTK